MRPGDACRLERLAYRAMQAYRTCWPQANGLSASSSLTVRAEPFVIPAKVAQFHDDADQFKVYDAGRFAIGDLQPDSRLPMARAPRSTANTGSSAVSDHLAVAVAVTCSAAGAATGAASPRARRQAAAGGTPQARPPGVRHSHRCAARRGRLRGRGGRLRFQTRLVQTSAR